MKWHVSNDHPPAPLEMICDACNFQTFNQKLWNKHIQIHDEGGEKTESLTCQFCYFVTSDSESIERHIATTHPRAPNCESDTKRSKTDIVKNSDRGCWAEYTHLDDIRIFEYTVIGNTNISAYMLRDIQIFEQNLILKY